MVGAVGKKKLTIKRCKVSNGKAEPLSGAGNEFQVMLNPNKYTHTLGISYDQTAKPNGTDCQKKPLGEVASETQFSAINPEQIGFELVFDNTGVANSPGQPGVAVKQRIDDLKDIVYRYVGEQHQPSVVQLVWDDLSFYGRLTSMTVDYTLFKPSGEPLRAKVNLGFISFMTKAEQSLRANRSSPDLTHVVEVNAGDTLPLLCQRIYNDSSYYLEVARINGLAGFRDITPGQRLHFPPLR